MTLQTYSLHFMPSIHVMTPLLSYARLYASCLPTQVPKDCDWTIHESMEVWKDSIRQITNTFRM